MRSQAQGLTKDSKPANSAKTQRLHKLLAQSGIGSRREMEKYIEAGRVYVNDSPATLGQLIHEHDIIKIDGKTTHLFFDLKFPKILIYHKPEGEIEEIRGVALNPNAIRQLQERDWIDVIGQKDVPGRPSLYATTKHFLNDFNLRSLSELPDIESFLQNEIPLNV